MFNIFKKPADEESYVTSDEFAIRISEIRSRIADIRRDQGWDQKPPKNSPSQRREVYGSPKLDEPKPDMGSAQKAKEDEMNALKAKLLKGRK